MGKTYWKLIRRSIKNNKGRFLSIFIIVALGSGFLAGLLATSTIMENRTDEFLDTYNMYDIEIVGSLGITDKDIESVNEVNDASNAYGVNSVDTIMVDNNGEKHVVRITAVPADTLSITSGDLPSEGNEGVIEIINPFDGDYSNIETLTLEDGEEIEGLVFSEFNIIGEVESPYNISIMSQISQNGIGEIIIELFVTEEAFDSEVYTSMYVEVAGAKSLSFFEEDYETLIEDTEKILEEVGIIRSQIRTEDVITVAEEKILEEEENLNTEIANIEDATWYIFNREDNICLATYKNDVTKVRSISVVFPVFFFAVTILVALTTMSRKIEEERTQIGALKSLGFTNREIFRNYLVYSLVASITGSVIGAIIGFEVFPSVIDNAYSILYTLPSVYTEIMLSIGVPIAIIITFSVTLASYFSCRGLLREKAASILLPKAPKIGKRIFLEKISFIWKRMSFSNKVTMRNIFRYKKRLLMTVIGIAGSFALLICGFGLKDSIGDIVERQFDYINKSDFSIYLTNENFEEDENLYSILNDENYITNYGEFYNGLGEVYIEELEDEKQETVIIIPEELSTISEFYGLKNRVSGENITFDETSFVITEKMSEKLGVSVGDEVVFKVDEKNEATFEVTGIAENYIQNEVFISKELYEEVFGEEVEFLVINGMINYDNENLYSTIEKTFGESDIISYYGFTETTVDSFNKSIESINSVVYVIIICSGLLIAVVLYNLININICERKKELATIKVLGFYNKEVYSYIFRETNLLCILGGILGIPLGILLHQFIVRVIEVDDAMFGREIYGSSYIYSIVIATIFVFIVNCIMRKSIKNINMVEAMKAND